MFKIETMKCSEHGEYVAEFVRVFSDSSWSGGVCPQCLAQREALAARSREIEIQRQKNEYINSIIQRSGIPPRFKDCKIANYQTTEPGSDDVRKTAAWYAKTWSERAANGTSLIFCGLPGTGKTHLACAIGNQLLHQGITVLYTTVYDVMRMTKATYDRNSSISEAKVLELYTSAQLLILDEIQIQTASDYERRIMFEIVNYRYGHYRPTFVISNLPFEQLQDFLGDRIVDRFRDRGGKLLKFVWKSYRG